MLYYINISFTGGIDMSNLPISLEELIYAALLAFCITWFINNAIKIRKIMKAASMTVSTPKDIASVMDRCYSLFPLENVEYRGVTFTRGMQIKITTTANADFVGEFIGGNTQNMVCIKTSKYIIAHKLSNIINITKM